MIKVGGIFLLHVCTRELLSLFIQPSLFICTPLFFTALGMAWHYYWCISYYQSRGVWDKTFGWGDGIESLKSTAVENAKTAKGVAKKPQINENLMAKRLPKLKNVTYITKACGYRLHGAMKEDGCQLCQYVGPCLKKHCKENLVFLLPLWTILFY